MIPARIRTFSTATIDRVSGLSRTTRWRRGQRGRLGADVVRCIQEDRAMQGLPALSADMEAEILATLAAVEDARLAKVDEVAA